MRTPGRRARRHEIEVPSGVDLMNLSRSATYAGSAEHKTYPSTAGAPRPRADATKCDRRTHADFDLLTVWLRESIVAGRVGSPWEGNFPRYVWAQRDGQWYEGRLINREQGTYKGYAVTVDQLPRVLRK